MLMLPDLLAKEARRVRQGLGVISRSNPGGNVPVMMLNAVKGKRLQEMFWALKEQCLVCEGTSNGAIVNQHRHTDEGSQG